MEFLMRPGIYSADNPRGYTDCEWPAIRASQAALDRNDFYLAIAIITPLDRLEECMSSPHIAYQFVRIFVMQGLFVNAERTIRLFIGSIKRPNKPNADLLFFDLLLAWICMFSRGAFVAAIKLALAAPVKRFVSQILDPFRVEEGPDIFLRKFGDWLRITNRGHRSFLAGIVADDGEVATCELLDSAPVGLKFQVLFLWLQILTTTEVSNPNLGTYRVEIVKEGDKYRIYVSDDEDNRENENITLYRAAHEQLISSWFAVTRIRHALLLRGWHEEVHALLSLSVQLFLGFSPPTSDEITEPPSGGLYLADFWWNDAHMLWRGISMEDGCTVIPGGDLEEYRPNLWTGEALRCQLWVIKFLSTLSPEQGAGIIDASDVESAEGMPALEADFSLMLRRATAASRPPLPDYTRVFRIDTICRSRQYIYLRREFGNLDPEDMERLTDFVAAQIPVLEEAGAFLHAFNRRELIAQLCGLSGAINRCRTEHTLAYELAIGKGMGAKLEFDARLGATTAIEVFSGGHPAGTAQIAAALQEVGWYEGFLQRSSYSHIGDLNAVYGLLHRLYYQLGNDKKSGHYSRLARLQSDELAVHRSNDRVAQSKPESTRGMACYYTSDPRMRAQNGMLVDPDQVREIIAVFSSSALDEAIRDYDKYIQEPETVSRNKEFITRIERICKDTEKVGVRPQDKAYYYLANLKWRTLQLDRVISDEERRDMRESGISNCQTIVDRSENVRLLAAAEHVWAELIIDQARIRQDLDGNGVYETERLEEVIQVAVFHSEKEQKLLATQRQRLLALAKTDVLKGWEAKRSYIDREEWSSDSLYLAQYLLLVRRDEDAWKLVQRAKARSMTDMLGTRAAIPFDLEFAAMSDEEGYALLQKERELLDKMDNMDLAVGIGLYWEYQELLGRMRNCPVLKDIIAIRGEEDVTKQELDEILGSEELEDMFLPDSFQGNVCFAEYGLFGGHIYLFMLKPGQPTTSHRLCREDWGVEGWIADNLNRPTLSRTALYAEAFAQLDFLIEPLVTHTKPGDLIVICPTGPLHRIPLHALGWAGQVLIERNPVIYTHSASTLRRCFHQARTRRASHATLSVSVIGDLSGNRQTAGSSAAELAKSLGAERTLIGKPTKPANAQASVSPTDSVKATASGASILHYHGHATHNGSDPQELNLWLSPAASLSLQDIASLKLSPGALVSLIACGSYVQNWTEGDEGLGIIPVFLYAGAASGVATFWPVVSSTGAAFSRGFYQGLQSANACEEGGSYSWNLATSFQRAVLEVRKQKPAPYHWAAFALTGYWYFRWMREGEVERVEVMDFDIEDFLADKYI